MVTLDILNTPNAAGDIVVSKGTPVEVDFVVTGDSSKNDELHLIRVDNNAVVSKKKRGTTTTGTVNLHTNTENGIATLRVDYVQAGVAVGSAPDQVVVVADEGSVVLSDQIAALQTQLDLIDTVQGQQIAQLQTDLLAAQGNITTELPTRMKGTASANRRPRKKSLAHMSHLLYLIRMEKKETIWRPSYLVSVLGARVYRFRLNEI